VKPRRANESQNDENPDKHNRNVIQVPRLLASAWLPALYFRAYVAARQNIPDLDRPDRENSAQWCRAGLWWSVEISGYGHYPLRARCLMANLTQTVRTFAAATAEASPAAGIGSSFGRPLRSYR
jgi:hypothetical protein